MEFITCVKSIQEGYVHATAGLEKDDPECDLDYCKGEGVPDGCKLCNLQFPGLWRTQCNPAGKEIRGVRLQEVDHDD